MNTFLAIYFYYVMLFTRLLPDITHVMKLRGYLLRCAFKKCGKNLQLANDVRISGFKKITIGDDVFFSGGVWILAGAELVIENQVMFGPYSVAVSGDHARNDGSFRFGPPVRQPIFVGRGAWIGAGAVLTKGARVGNGSCIAAGAVAIGEVEPNSLYAGAPAKFVKKFGA